MKSWLLEADYSNAHPGRAWQWALQGMVTAASLSEIKEHLDNTQAHGVIFGGVQCRDPGVGLDDPYSPFQLRTLCCMIHELLSEPVLTLYAFAFYIVAIL